ncbi:hypothetical protein CNMCM8927_008618 [Aspergillus lentulus]|uniref:Malonyl-CoA:ACP transacylase (MAT) domain-containing protein n=1 Tax=Aspergillus lentulus TaxID=293939 RepID=A0AAN5YNE0_ASPLE|nr:hypothetical protein CNMCM8927_008618 [Aspergillus lentulus]
MAPTQSSTPSMTYNTPSSTAGSVDPFSSLVPFSLKYRDLEYTTYFSLEHVVALEHHRAVFLAAFESTAPVAPKSVECLVFLFVQFLLDHHVDKASIKPWIESFEKDFLTLTDIHSVIASLPESRETQKSLLGTYFAACSWCNLPAESQQSALFKEAQRGHVILLAVFGGQGPSNPRCFRDFQDIYQTYAPLLQPLVKSIGDTLHGLCREPETREFFRGREIDLSSWMEDSSTVPEDEFLATAPVSLPLLGAIGLAHWCVLCKVLGKTPGDVRSLLSGVTGHSQGVIAAVAVSGSDSWPSFYDNAKLVIKLLFWLGYECHRDGPRAGLSSAAFYESRVGGDDQPTSMLHVSGLGRAQLLALLDRCNRNLPATQQVYHALSNSRLSHTLAGPASSLVLFNRLVRDTGPKPGTDQSRIPFDQRKPSVEAQFLPISTPFHTPYLDAAARRVKERLSSDFVDPSDLLIPVYHTRDGSDMRATASNILSSLIDAITSHHVDWPSTLNGPKYTHVIAIGKGVAEMVAKNVDGKGVKVISATESTPSNDTFGCQSDIFTSHLPETFLNPQAWGEEFRPRLVRSSKGAIRLQTKLTKLLDMPPIMVAGMTPTTVHWDFVAAIMNAGYHAELAGGGYHRAEDMSAAITKLTEHLPADRGITCNLIYVSPQTMTWQITMLRQLARSGRPIDGLTIGAGVPSLEVASDYITTLGLKHIAFKPGSEDAIERVLEIARAHQNFPVIIQWTGGRGGGHHSYEDFHAPILQLYGKIRLCPNVVLVAGSGFGDAAGSYPYLTGSWSLLYGYPPMPFDGILLGSRMMVAKEAHTSPSVKRLICSATGTTDAEWTQSYSKPVGGIVTVQSEMGQPIHKIATRGVLFWKEMDDQVFSLPQSQQLDAINERREHIIRKLNEDFAKPWFGRNHEGEVVDLAQMTYLEILHRLVDLMYVPQKKCWIDPSYSVLVRDFVARTLERFHAVSAITMDQPDQWELFVHSACPQTSSAVIHPEDESWFVKRCRARGQKPVNFVPRLDADLAHWMKKDSLWQSEDIEAVADQDPGRVCILQGPVAVQYSRQVDESAADILNGITHSLIQSVNEEFYKADVIPSACMWESSYPLRRSDFDFQDYNGIKTFQAPPDGPLPGQDNWMRFLATKTRGWMRSIFASDSIIRGRRKQTNCFKQILQVSRETVLEISEARSSILLKQITSGKALPLVELSSPDGGSIHAQIFHYRPGSDSPTVLSLQFHYDPQNALYPLREEMEHRNGQIKSFYNRLWLGSDVKNGFGPRSTFGGYTTILSRETLRDWISSVGLAYDNDRRISPSMETFPLNATIIPAWEALIEPLMLPSIDGDLLRLVHLSIEFKLFPGVTPLRVDETVKVTSQVQSIIIGDSGKTVTVAATLAHDDNTPAVLITSRFLIQGSFSDISGTFECRDEPEMIVKISSPIDNAVLRARTWLILDDEKVELVGESLLFRLQTFCSWKTREIFSTLRTTGPVFIQDFQGKLQKIGQVVFEAMDCYGNPVIDFLTRKGKPAVERHDLDDPGWPTPSSTTIKMPSSNEVYSAVSKDVNPIHTSSSFATLANLPGIIVHGMYTSAVTSTVLDQATHDFNHLRTRRYSISFVDMVLPGEAIEIKYRHIAMVQGRMVLQVQASKAASGGKVLEGEVELEQVPTGYFFTGQGSQAPGMGMELYKSSPVAKRIWDEIDHYLLEKYGERTRVRHPFFSTDLSANEHHVKTGWSMLEIVQENPKRLTVHFSGKRGRAIRARYMAMAVHTVAANGQVTTTPLLPSLTSSARSFTFEEPKGLLYATQFAQPAITVLEKATFEDMRAKGLIQEGAPFAGHSLGEYGALACLGEFIGFQDLMDIAFYRGMTMQMAVDRDSDGATDYSMVAVNPARVNRVFNQSALSLIAATIATKTGELLEIVNYNVEGEQYVCAGHNFNLYALAEVLNSLSKLPCHHISQWMHESSSSTGNDQSPSTTAISSLIHEAIRSAQALPKPIVLARGTATIPLSGIDVPFHSSHLRPGVAAWRNFLLTRIRPENVQPDALEGKFVPNVMGQPFSLDRAYIAEAARLTGSDTLRLALEDAAC